MLLATIADLALGTLAYRAWRARGGFLPPLRAVTVCNADTVTLRIVEVAETVRVIGTWTIASYADVPDAIRVLENQDMFLSGLVFHDRIGPDGCFWELVHPTTLEASRMFGRVWRESYGSI